MYLMNLHVDTVKLICFDLSNKDKLMLFSTCKFLNKLRSEIIYTDPVELHLICHLTYLNNFKFIQISCKSSSVANIHPTKLIIKNCIFNNFFKMIYNEQILTHLTHLYIINDKCKYCTDTFKKYRKVSDGLFDDAIIYIFIRCKKLIHLETYFIPTNDSLISLSNSLKILKIFNESEQTWEKTYGKNIIIPANIVKLSLPKGVTIADLTYNKLEFLSTDLEIYDLDLYHLVMPLSLKKLSIKSRIAKKTLLDSLDLLIEKNNLKYVKVYVSSTKEYFVPARTTHLVIENYIPNSEYYDFGCEVLHTVIIKSMLHADNIFSINIPTVHTLIFKQTITQEITQKFVDSIPLTIKKICLYTTLSQKIFMPESVELIRTSVSNRPYVISKNLIMFDYIG